MGYANAHPRLSPEGFRLRGRAFQAPNAKYGIVATHLFVFEIRLFGTIFANNGGIVMNTDLITKQNSQVKFFYPMQKGCIVVD